MSISPVKSYNSSIVVELIVTLLPFPNLYYYVFLSYFIIRTLFKQHYRDILWLLLIAFVVALIPSQRRLLDPSIYAAKKTAYFIKVWSNRRNTRAEPWGQFYRFKPSMFKFTHRLWTHYNYNLFSPLKYRKIRRGPNKVFWRFWRQRFFAAQLVDKKAKLKQKMKENKLKNK